MQQIWKRCNKVQESYDEKLAEIQNVLETKMYFANLFWCNVTKSCTNTENYNILKANIQI